MVRLEGLQKFLVGISTCRYSGLGSGFKVTVLFCYTTLPRNTLSMLVT